RTRGSRYPPPLGLSVIVPPGVRELGATVRYANYERIEREEPDRERPRKVWKRIPMPGVTETIDLDDRASSDPGVAVRDSRGLRLITEVQVLPPEAGVPAGSRAVAVFLVNHRAPETAPGLGDGAFVFQVELTLECEAGFVPRPDRS